MAKIEYRYIEYLMSVFLGEFIEEGMEHLNFFILWDKNNFMKKFVP